MLVRQAQEVADGIKTQTCRLRKQRDELVYEGGQIVAVKRGGRVLYKVGGTYAVVPKYGQACALIGPKGNLVTETVDYRYDSEFGNTWSVNLTDGYLERGYTPLRLRILRIETGPLQSMIDATAAKREGVDSVEAYIALWSSINGPKSWAKDPDVFIYHFERVLAAALPKQAVA